MPIQAALRRAIGERDSTVGPEIVLESALTQQAVVALGVRREEFPEMPLRITCQFCGKAFSAWNDLVGQSVKCPKCGQDMIVPGSALDRPPARNVPQPPPESSRTAPRRELTPPGKSPETTRTVKVTPSPRPSPAPPVAKRPKAAAAPPLVIPVSTPPTAAVDTVPCPNCNAPMPLNDDLCDECGYHLILRKVLDTSGVHHHNDATGFDRFLKGQLAENETAESALFWAHIVAGFCLLSLCVLCLGLLKGFLLAALIMGGYTAYRLATKERREREKDSSQGDRVSRTLWSAILGFQRVVGWRHTQWPFPENAHAADERSGL